MDRARVHRHLLGSDIRDLHRRYDETTARAQTYRELIERYVKHPDPKCLGPDGKPCHRETVGLLEPAHIDGFHVEQLGKEANHLEVVQAGIGHEAEEVYTLYTDRKRDPWRTLTLPVLRIMPRETLLSGGALQESALREVLAGRAEPHRTAKEQLQRLAVRFARDKLDSEGQQVPHHPLAALYAYASRQSPNPTCLTYNQELQSDRATYCSDACRQAAYRQRSHGQVKT